MSMTESEAIAIIEDVTWKDFGRHYGKVPIAREMAILALEEVQKYRAIGTVSEFRENKNFLEFLYNAINPNDMEQYLAMYHASGRKGEYLHE